MRKASRCLVLAVLYCSTCFGSPPGASLSSDQEFALVHVCMKLTRSTLNDPDSAQFDALSAPREIKALKGGIYRVRFQGRAKNAFGALMLGTFECGVILGKTGGVTAFSPRQIR